MVVVGRPGLEEMIVLKWKKKIINSLGHTWRDENLYPRKKKPRDMWVDAVMDGGYEKWVEMELEVLM